MNKTEPISIAETRARLRADRERLSELLATRPWAEDGSLWFLPSYQCVVLHRWSHYLFSHRRRFLARLLWHINLLLTGADISPLADIGGGFVVMYPVSCIVIGKAGSNLTVVGHGGFGGGMAAGNVGGGPGLPVLGDNVWLDLGAVVIGPVHIGDHVQLCARALVTHDVPAGSVVDCLPSRIRSRATEAELSAK